MGFGIVSEPSNDAETQALMFVRAWAEEVVRQVERVTETRRSVGGAYRMQGEIEGIDEEFLAGRFRELWTAEHTLLWAAYQLERWRTRLDKERDNGQREEDKELKQARNVLEHLDTADFVGDRAVAPALPPSEPGRKKPRDPHWSLRKLGGLDISLTDDGTFCGIPSAELGERALNVVSSVERDLGEAAADHLADLLRKG